MGFFGRGGGDDGDGVDLKGTRANHYLLKDYWFVMVVYDSLRTAYFLTGAQPLTNSTVINSETKEAGWTASIIPFPVRTRPAEATSPDRLVRALASLQAALEDQRIAVAAWREVLTELKTSTTGLHESLKAYRTNLQTLGDSVSALRDKAQSLEAWADTVTAANPDWDPLLAHPKPDQTT
jgi:hypothetical protein